MASPLIGIGTSPWKWGGINHKGATLFPEQVDKYIEKEIQKGATIGPFECIPFKTCPVAISPISTRPKRECKDRRVILDCSWPIGASLNDGIDKDVYLGKPFKLKYPTIDMLSRRIYQLSRENPKEDILLFKEDLDRAFRQLRGDPISVPLMGSHWRGGYYFDLVAVMGCRIAPYICQKTTNMLVYIHKEMGFHAFNYVDDFIGSEYRSRIYQAHKSFVNLLRDTGFQRSEKKSVPPTQVIEFVGNLVNTVDFTMGVTAACREEVLRELESWRTRVTCTRTQLESLIGKLQFMSNCIKPGRLFVSRLLNQLKGMQRNKWYHVTDEMRRDIKWWYLFLPDFQGCSIMWLIDVFQVDGEFAVNSCLKGAGGVRGDQYFKLKYPRWFLGKHDYKITHLELWAIIIAMRIWGEQVTGKVFRVKMDNEAVAQIVNSGRSQDLLLQKLLRELLWWTSKYECKIKSVHLSGQVNCMPDLLSRWHEGRAIADEFWSRGGESMCECRVRPEYLQFTHEW